MEKNNINENYGEENALTFDRDDAAPDAVETTAAGEPDTTENKSDVNAGESTEKSAENVEETKSSETENTDNADTEAPGTSDAEEQTKITENGDADVDDLFDIETKPNVPSEEDQLQKIRRISKAEKQVRGTQRFLLHIILFVIVVWVLFTYVIGIATVPNGDMYPRLDAGDLLIYYRLDKNVKAQDIVIFKKNDTRYVGRVAAVAGDTVEITEDDQLIVNGNRLIESNIFSPGTPRYEGFVEYPITLGAGECFILCDKRMGGEDSRYFGPVSTSEIMGTVITLMRRNNL